MSDYVIRYAVPGDAKQILSIYEPYILDTAITFETEPVSLEGFRDRMAKVQARFPWLVYEEEGKIIGYAYASSYRERAAFAWDCESSVYVAKESQRKGVATKLYTKLLELLTQQGFYNIYAFITYPHDSSVVFHKKFGFKEIGIFHRTGYKMGVWWDLLVMEKVIGDFEQIPVQPRLPGKLI